MIVGEPAKDHKLKTLRVGWFPLHQLVLIYDLTTGPLEVVITTLWVLAEEYNPEAYNSVPTNAGFFC